MVFGAEAVTLLEVKVLRELAVHPLMTDTAASIRVPDERMNTIDAKRRQARPPLTDCCCKLLSFSKLV